MLTRANVILHLAVAFVVLAFGGYDGFEVLFVLVGLALVATSSHLALLLAGQRRNNGLAALTIGLIVFFWVAYSAKFALAMFIAEDYWVVPKLIDLTAMMRILPEAYFLSSIGYVAMLVGILSFPLRQSIDWRIGEGRSRYWLMITLLAASLVLKYLLKARFQLGVPGAEPIQLGVPYLSAVLALLLEFGYLFFANVPLFLALHSGKRWLILFGFVVAIANAGIDLRFGSKDTVMYQMALTVVYLFMFRRGLTFGREKFRSTARAMFVIMGGLGLLVISAYKYVNFLRYAFLSGSTDVFSATQVAAQSDIAQSRSSLVELFNRITGLEAFSAVIYLGESMSFSARLSDLLNGNLMRRFSDIVLLGLDSNAAFTMTLVGSWHVYGGVPGIIFGFLFTGAVFAFLQYVILRAPGMSHNMRLAFLPVYWIMCVQLTLGGNPTIWLKTMIVTLPFVFFVGRYAFRRPPRHRRET